MSESDQSDSPHPPTALVVEDDPAVRAVTVFMLERAGFRVLEASDGREAIARCSEHRFDAFIVDVGLPGTSGVEILRQLLDAQPSAGAVLISGKIDVPKGGGLGAKVKLLQKPFNRSALVEAIRASLKT